MTAIEDLIRRVEALEKELAAMRNKPCNHTWRGGNPDGTGLFACEHCGIRMTMFRESQVPAFRLSKEEIEKSRAEMKAEGDDFDVNRDEIPTAKL